jgi:hypothetical protein
MTPELQSVLDKLEEVERRNRGLRSLTLLSMLLSLAVLAFVVASRAVTPPSLAPPATRLAGVVEANRFLLRDAHGVVRGGMEVEPGGTAKLVIGNQDGHTGAAVILAQPTGLVQVQLRSPGGLVRAAINGGIEPSVTVVSDDGTSGAALVTKSGRQGQLLLSDRGGTLRPNP